MKQVHLLTSLAVLWSGPTVLPLVAAADSDDFSILIESSDDDEDSNLVRLKADNFYEKTLGKRVFILFSDPMCGHCLLMAEDWAKLADEHQDNDDILIGKVDCTKQINRPMCADFGVTGFPTLLYGDVIDLQKYNGHRDLELLRQVVKEYLDEPLCGVTRPQLCNAATKQKIDDLVLKGRTKLEEEINEIEEKLFQLEEDKQEFINGLRRKHSEAMRRKEMEKRELQKEIQKIVQMLKIRLEMNAARALKYATSKDEL